MNKKQVVVQNLRGKLVLDAGCGIGDYSIEAAKYGFEIIAIDLSKKQLKHAKKQFKIARVKIPIVNASLTHLPFKDYVFDSSMCCDVIEHIPQLNLTFSELRRILSDEGIICVTTVNGYGIYGILYDLVLRNFFLMKYVSETSKLLMKGEIETEHVHRFSPKSLRKIVGKSFKITHFTNLKFLATLYHFVFRCILRANIPLINFIENADMQHSSNLPLNMGSEWLLCAIK